MLDFARVTFCYTWVWKSECMIEALTDRFAILCYFLILWQIFNNIIIIMAITPSAKLPETITFLFLTLFNSLFSTQCSGYNSGLSLFLLETGQYINFLPFIYSSSIFLVQCGGYCFAAYGVMEIYAITMRYFTLKAMNGC